jgi:hypothetical protein
MGWAVEALADDVENVRPRFGLPDHPALWLTERGGQIRPAEINAWFVAYPDSLGLPAALSRTRCATERSVSRDLEPGSRRLGSCGHRMCVSIKKVRASRWGRSIRLPISGRQDDAGHYPTGHRTNCVGCIHKARSLDPRRRSRAHWTPECSGHRHRQDRHPTPQGPTHLQESAACATT